MYGYNPLYQPYYQPQQRQDLPKVNGIDGARAYPMAPNSTAAVFDANQDVMYVIKTDSACYPSVRRFSFQEIVENNESTPGREDQILDVLNEIKEMLSNGKQSVRTRSDSGKSDKSSE